MQTFRNGDITETLMKNVARPRPFANRGANGPASSLLTRIKARLQRNCASKDQKPFANLPLI
jgi:hypothetical protein